MLLFCEVNEVWPQEQLLKDYDTLVEDSFKSYDNGDYNSAIKFMNNAINIAKIIYGDCHPIYIPMLKFQAESYINLGDNDKVIQLYNQAIDIQKNISGSNTKDYALLLIDFAAFYYKIENNEQVIALCNPAINILSSINKNDIDNSQYSFALGIIADSYYELQEYTKAVEFYTLELECIKILLGKNNEDYSLVLNALANSYSKIGEHSKAIEFYEQELETLKVILGESDSEYMKSLEDLKEYCTAYGRYDKALELEFAKLHIIKTTEGEKSVKYARVLCNIGNRYSDLENYDDAIKFHTQALTIIRENNGDKTDIVFVLFNLANSYSGLGNDIKAIEVSKDAISVLDSMDEKSRDIEVYVFLLHNMGNYYARLKSPNISDELHAKALEEWRKINGKNNVKYAYLLNTVAGRYTLRNDYQQAINLYQQSLDIWMDNGGANTMYFESMLSNFAATCYLAGDYNKAIELLTKLINTQKNTVGEVSDAYCFHLCALLSTYVRANDFSNLLQVWESLYTNFKAYALSSNAIFTSKERHIFWNKWRKCLMECIGVCSAIFNSNNIANETTYNYLLLTKGANLLIDIEFDKVIRESGNKVLLEKLKELRTIHTLINTYSNQTDINIEQLKSKSRELEKDLIVGSKEYADFTHSLSIDWMNVQSSLGENDVAIEILAAGGTEDSPPYYASLILRRNWETPKYVLLSTDELYKYFTNNKKLSSIYNDIDTRQLYNLIWSKLEPYINEGDNVYFSPMGLLHQMNIEVFQDANGKRANEKWNLHRVSSTRELCMEKPEIDMTSAVLYGNLLYDVDSTTMVAQSRTYRQEDNYVASRGFVQDSTMRNGWKKLDATNTEINSIAMTMQACGIEPTIYKLETGNEESFKALSGKKTPIIHLATHGFFYKDEEAKTKTFFETLDMNKNNYALDNSLKRSGLILAGAQKAWLGEPIPDNVEDGVLLAEEIATMDLTGTDLVVLSACETGLGEITSEGVFGLQRAFKKAGVQTLIMSLWKVDDNATSLFMRTFYKQWLGGKSKHAAFLDAQAAVRECKESDYSNPYYWASFIMLD